MFMASGDICQVKPVKAFLSTNLNNRNKTFQDLADRILRQLGWPMINIPLHRDQIYDAISIAIEFFTKYVTAPSELLMFSSDIYERDKGIRLDKVYTIASSKNPHPELYRKTFDKTVEVAPRNYVAIRKIEKEELPPNYFEDIPEAKVITPEQYDEIVFYNPGLCAFFKINRGIDFTIEGQRVPEQPTSFENTYDYDLMDYRKITQVTSYDESANRTWSSLFTLESALAAQAFYTYQFSSASGFDLLSFHCLSEYLKTRRRVLALDKSFYFNPYTQYLTILPQVKPESSFYAIIEVYPEHALRDIINKIWIFKYALAQCKVILGTIRGTYGNVTLAGGGSISDNINLRASGEKEIEALERELTTETAFSEKQLPKFFIG